MSFTVALLPSISSISSTHLTPAVNSVEPSCCDYLAARISAIWQAFCTLLSEWVGWFFASTSKKEILPQPAVVTVLSPAPKEDAKGKVAEKKQEASEPPVPAATLERAPHAITVQSVVPQVVNPPAARVKYRKLHDVIEEIWLKTSKKMPLDFSVARLLLNEGAAWKEGTPLIALIQIIQQHEKLPQGHREAFAQFAKELIDAYVKAGVTLDDKYVTQWAGGGSALNYAVGAAIKGKGGFGSSWPIPECLELAKILIAQGANLEVEDNSNKTPLGIALAGGNELFRHISDAPDLQLANLLLRRGANLGAKFSKQDLTTLFEKASNLKKRIRSLPFDAMITAFMADRLRAIVASTPLLIPALRQIVSDYLCEGRFDPMPLALKLSAELFSAEMRLSPNIRRLIIQYTLEAQEMTDAVSAQIVSTLLDDYSDRERTREDFEENPIGIDPAANAAEVVDPPAAAAPEDDSDEE